MIWSSTFLIVTIITQKLAMSVDKDFHAKFSPVVTPDETKNAEAVLINEFGDLNYSTFDDKPVKYSEDEFLCKEDFTNPIKQEVKRIKLSQKD